jgi:dTDP-4-amino-4,6-dideoxygalactose transaminase
MIPITKPFIPPIEEYNELLKGIWQRNWLTNNGPLVNDLELRLKQYLNLDHLLLVSNGTIAIQFALKALNIKKDVITTPFSYVATTSSIVWEGCTPVFVDIDPDTLNIDPSKIEKAVTDRTQAILATHCFGNPCDVEAISAIASKHNLKVIYDAAHCFGTLYKGKTIFSFGDISTTSFHATKPYNTVEGGAVFTSNPKMLKEIAYFRNFGHAGPEKFYGIGINGKNSEFHAAMGICNLNHINAVLASRKRQAETYDKLLSKAEISTPNTLADAVSNNAYYPVVFRTHEIMQRVKIALEKQEIFPRRYFYPSLSSLNYVTADPTPVADDIASRILCLPMYFELSEMEQKMVARIILRTLRHG